MSGFENEPIIVEEQDAVHKYGESYSATHDETSDYFSSSSEFSEDESATDYYHMDLTETLKLEIENEEYICLICTGDIGINSRIWNCETCYRVYDLDCITDWSLRGIRDSQGGKKTWKCPSCNYSYNQAVLDYRCWCKKVVDPFYNGLMPHSCGQTCGAKLNCIHRCPSMCHPGPHTECTAIGPSICCECGKSERQWPCVITPYEGWKCKQTCGEMMPCGEHTCSKPCHSGLCGKCTTETKSTCYCGKLTKYTQCSERRSKWSEVLGENGEAKKWIGSFACEEICDGMLDCGVHKCELSCHSREPGDHACPLQPKENETCHCGSIPVSVLLGHERNSCQEHIPSCGNTCGKSLPCGHPCRSRCHAEECPPCRQITTVKCDCESHLFDVPCTFVQSGSTAKCQRRCTALMDCRRHRCSEVCCKYEKKAFDRERARKKKFRGKYTSDIADPDEIIETAHQCDLVCNKLLNCGLHYCQMTCHNGPCIPCLESSMDDWYCPCGRTILRAPIRCGSMKPHCKFPCPLDPTCGHPRVEHDCHDDTVGCPKCPHLVEEPCVCGKKTIKGVQCHRPASTISCGIACGLPLDCGHKCTKVCHSPGDCEVRCKSQCEQLLPCGHPHKGVCHRDSSCDMTDCKELVTLKCECENHSRAEICKGTREREILKCDQNCAIKEGNRKLAEALQIDLEKRSQTEHVYNDDLLDLYYTDPAWGDEIEKSMIEFAQDSRKEIKFLPMNSLRRMFVHLLAEEFKLTTYSLDSEPNRSVVVMRSLTCEIPAAQLRKYYKPIKWD